MTSSDKAGDQRDEVQAHRGSSAVAPDNTLATFQAAARQGAKLVELDVALSAYGSLVVIHDDGGDRTGSLGFLTRSDLARLDAGSWFGASFAGERIPTMAERLETLSEFDLNADVEIKQHPHHQFLDQLTQAVKDVLHTRAPHTQFNIATFEAHTLAAMHKLEPALEMAMLGSKVPADWKSQPDAILAKTIHLHCKALSIGLLEEVSQWGLKVRAWTRNQPKVLASSWAAGLTGVITDNPAAFPS